MVLIAISSLGQQHGHEEAPDAGTLAAGPGIGHPQFAAGAGTVQESIRDFSGPEPETARFRGPFAGSARSADCSSFTTPTERANRDTDPISLQPFHHVCRHGQRTFASALTPSIRILHSFLRSSHDRRSPRTPPRSPLRMPRYLPRRFAAQHPPLDPLIVSRRGGCTSTSSAVPCCFSTVAGASETAVPAQRMRRRRRRTFVRQSRRSPSRRHRQRERQAYFDQACADRRVHHAESHRAFRASQKEYPTFALAPGVNAVLGPTSLRRLCPMRLRRLGRSRAAAELARTRRRRTAPDRALQSRFPPSPMRPRRAGLAFADAMRGVASSLRRHHPCALRPVAMDTQAGTIGTTAARQAGREIVATLEKCWRAIPPTLARP